MCILERGSPKSNAGILHIISIRVHLKFFGSSLGSSGQHLPCLRPFLEPCGLRKKKAIREDSMAPLQGGHARGEENIKNLEFAGEPRRTSQTLSLQEARIPS